MSFKLPRSHFAGAAAARARTTFPVWRFRMTKKGIYLKRQKMGFTSLSQKKKNSTRFIKLMIILQLINLILAVRTSE
jgi:hypothetical protein